MAGVKVEGSLGKTVYVLEDDSPGNVRITRIQSSGDRKQMWVPRKLILEFALEALTPKVRDVIRGLLLG